MVSNRKKEKDHKTVLPLLSSASSFASNSAAPSLLPIFPFLSYSLHTPSTPFTLPSIFPINIPAAFLPFLLQDFVTDSSFPSTCLEHSLPSPLSSFPSSYPPQCLESSSRSSNAPLNSWPAHPPPPSPSISLLTLFFLIHSFIRSGTCRVCVCPRTRRRDRVNSCATWDTAPRHLRSLTSNTQLVPLSPSASFFPEKYIFTPKINCFLSFITQLKIQRLFVNSK